MFPKRLATLTLLLLIVCLAPIACGGTSGSDPAADEPPPVPALPALPFAEIDFEALADLPYAEAIKTVRAGQTWSPRSKALKSGADPTKDPRETLKLRMDRQTLDQSYELGQQFLINWQLPGGNFRYMYDWITETWIDDDHQVRQAGSLWGIATCYRHKPTEDARKALDKGLEFWFGHTVAGPGRNTLTLAYPGASKVDSGTVALVALAIIEYVKTDAPMDADYRKRLEAKLDGYLAFLQWMQLPNGHISKNFHLKSKKKSKKYNGYYDGESLLALTKAARQLGRKGLVETIEKAAPAMASYYTIEQWPKDIDSDVTKGFFQWGCMSYLEYYQAEWKDHEVYGDVALSLAWWMTHTHATTKKRRNHAYAIEGLIAAWTIANMRGDIPAQTDLLYTLDYSLYKLSSWQIGGPLAKNNKFFAKQTTTDTMAVGGVMNARKPSGADPMVVQKRTRKPDVSHQLRIDVTQHQMHAVTTALEDVYRAK